MEVYLAYGIIWLFITIFMTIIAPDGAKFSEAVMLVLALQCFLVLTFFSVYAVIWSIEVLKAQ